MRAIVALIAMLIAAVGADPLRGIIRELAAEATSYRDAPQTMPAAADYAGRVPGAGPVEPEALVEALTRRAHRDPFTDAYIRWQLASLPGCDLGALDPDTFARMVREAPALVPCPNADVQLVSLLAQIELAGPLSASDATHLRELVARLDGDRARAELLNRPPVGFIDWVQGKLADDPLRRRQWLLVRLALTASAGWPVAELKSEVTKTLGDVDGEPPLTNRAKSLLARQLHALAGIERRAVDQVTFMADGSVRVTFTIGRVTARDIDRWIERLAG